MHFKILSRSRGLPPNFSNYISNKKPNEIEKPNEKPEISTS